MPGQATAYKTGERHFKKVRQKLEKELGKDFDIKRFHQQILNCFGPLSMLEECMKQKSVHKTTAKPKSKSSAQVVSPTIVALFITLVAARAFA